MKYKISIYDHNTGKQIERDMTGEEQAQRDIEIDDYLEAQAKLKKEAENLRNLKISAYERLGLSKAEIEALLPNPKPVNYGLLE
jgi:hypothetical protein